MTAKPLAVLSFSVREPVGIRSKLKRGSGKRLYISAEAKAFGERVKSAATIARAECPAWPRNVYVPSAVTLTVQLHGTRQDADACEKMVADFCQGILYENDRILSYGPKVPPIQDGLGRRVEVRAELFATYDAATARKREAAADARRAKPRKRKAPIAKPRWL